MALASLSHPSELWALLQVGLGGKTVTAKVGSTTAVKYCYNSLVKTSRSFAMVIQELGDELRDAVCIFYLVLRGLDTIEDDMAFPAATKTKMLVEFHEYLYQPNWTFSACGQTPDERDLLENFDKVIEVFLTLQSKYQIIIADICKRMGTGMAEFVTKEVDTVADWNLYCYYVAGLVGIGLSNMFAASGLEDPSFKFADEISNSMGLALQKTNIIRDYLEDINAVGKSRMFWPREIWRVYAENLEDFKDPKNSKEALHCLNHLITNALEHVPQCLEYLGNLKDQDNFNFCAIPQVMAIATLAACYNNHNVFTGVVKIRRGEACKILLGVKQGIKETMAFYNQYTKEILSKVPSDDPNATRAKELCNKIIDLTAPHLPPPTSTLTSPIVLSALAVVAFSLGTAYVIHRSKRN